MSAYNLNNVSLVTRALRAITRPFSRRTLDTPSEVLENAMALEAKANKEKVFPKYPEYPFYGPSKCQSKKFQLRRQWNFLEVFEKFDTMSINDKETEKKEKKTMEKTEEATDKNQLPSSQPECPPQPSKLPEKIAEKALRKPLSSVFKVRRSTTLTPKEPKSAPQLKPHKGLKTEWVKALLSGRRESNDVAPKIDPTTGLPMLPYTQPRWLKSILKGRQGPIYARANVGERRVRFVSPTPEPDILDFFTWLNNPPAPDAGLQAGIDWLRSRPPPSWDEIMFCDAMKELRIRPRSILKNGPHYTPRRRSARTVHFNIPDSTR